MQGAGYLAIWSDLTPDDETDWAHWITREHAAERVGINGFLACRIFHALGSAANRYFILYELDDENVVGVADPQGTLTDETSQQIGQWKHAGVLCNRRKSVPTCPKESRGAGFWPVASGRGVIEASIQAFDTIW
jgi:hypothetical protein